MRAEMRLRFPSRHGTVVAYLALFVALGGAAYAVKSAPKNSVSSKSIKAGAVKSADVADNKLTGADVDEGSLDLAKLRDGCPSPSTVPAGRTCAGSDGQKRNWNDSLTYCSDLGLRVPSLGEAIAMAKAADVPGVSGEDGFWSDELTEASGQSAAPAVAEDGNRLLIPTLTTLVTVCVTDPTNAG